jgi:Fe-S-cluster-containing dehydrogenase component/CRP-like cAMP-binding protein
MISPAVSFDGFRPALSEEEIDQILVHTPFSGLDQTGFPSVSSLRTILARHAGLLTCEPGDVILREGDHGNSAFVVLEGQVRGVTRPPLPAARLGRRRRARRGLLRSLFPGFRNPRIPELGSPTPGSSELAPDPALFRLSGIEDVIANHETFPVSAGDMFGELAALDRSPRTATVFAETAVRLVEIRRPGLRLMRRYAPELRERMDRDYRAHGLRARLREVEWFRTLSAEAFDTICAAGELVSVGDTEWYVALREGNTQPLALIVRQGDPVDAVYVVVNGFVRLAESHGRSETTVGFLRRGQSYGVDVNENSAGRFRHHLHAWGAVDLVRIPLAALPGHLGRHAAPRRFRLQHHEALDVFIDQGVLNGTAAMLVDLDRCTRCDECVQACAAGHDGNPRFVRDGPRLGNHMVASACMHCVDPVCQVDCPTGAIHRNIDGGQVVINDATCIGCGTCAASCPYGNIRMVQLHDNNGIPLRDSHDGRPVRKATSCDLCIDLPGGPACQRACPYDALIRVDMAHQARLDEWLSR